MNNDSVKDNIRNFRKNQNLTQSEMADKLGISRTAYRNIENGETRLISDNVGKIAEILKMDTAELVLGYLPDKGETDDSGDGKLMEEVTRRHADETARLSSQIANLKTEISSLRGYIETLKELIRTKDEIIAMLKKLDSEI